MSNIFEILFEEKICFTVIVSYLSLNSKDNSLCKKEYSIIALTVDVVGLNGFTKNDEYPLVSERFLSDFQIREFKEISDRFVKVENNKDGRIFELKNNSFQKKYKKIKS